MIIKRVVSVFFGGMLVFVGMNSVVYAGNNTVTVGLSTSVDVSERKYDDVSSKDNEEHRTLSLRPLVQLESVSKDSRFEALVQPSLKYDLIDSELDWDQNIYLYGKKAFSQKWIADVSNTFVKSDYHQNELNQDDMLALYADETVAQNPLSTDIGRRRYTRNTSQLNVTHVYGNERIFVIGSKYELLRYETSEGQIYNDYDRYEFFLNNKHRLSRAWSTGVDFSVVRGDYKPAGDMDSQSSVLNDMYEYRAGFRIDNSSLRQHTIGLGYNYVGVRYDERDINDLDIHSLGISLNSKISYRIETKISAGPSYRKTEGKKSTWGIGGGAEVNYLLDRGKIIIGARKGYDVDNFTGTDEQGSIEYLEAWLAGDYEIMKALSLAGRITYRDEARDGLQQVVEEIPVDNDKKRYMGRISLNYSFMRNFSSSLSYTYVHQTADVVTDDYDDHRALLALSWKQSAFTW